MARLRAHLLLGGLALPLAVGLWAAGPASSAHPGCALAAAANHVAIVVEHGNGAVLTACLAFAEGSLTGEEVIQRSGIQYGTIDSGGLGRAVCQVDHEPATYPPSCWTPTSRYWALYIAHGSGAWAPGSAGISGQRFVDGDALGWHYVPQSGGGGGPPPSPAGVCAVVSPSPSPAAAAPSPSPTATGGATPPPLPAVSPTVIPVTPSAEPPPASAPASPGPPASPAPAATVPAVTPPRPPEGPRMGWLAAAAGGGGLLGLLVLQVGVRRRRR